MLSLGGSDVVAGELQRTGNNDEFAAGRGGIAW